MSSITNEGTVGAAGVGNQSPVEPSPGNPDTGRALEEPVKQTVEEASQPQPQLQRLTQSQPSREKDNKPQEALAPVETGSVPAENSVEGNALAQNVNIPPMVENVAAVNTAPEAAGAEEPIEAVGLGSEEKPQEAGIAEQVDPPAVAPPAVAPPAVDPPAVDPPAVDPPAVDPPAQPAEAEEPINENGDDEGIDIQALTEHVMNILNHGMADEATPPNLLLQKNFDLQQFIVKLIQLLKEKTELCSNLDRQNSALISQAKSLKDVIAITKDLLGIRNMEIEHLHADLAAMDDSIKEERTRNNTAVQRLTDAMSINDKLKAEYLNQMTLFGKLRDKYNEKVMFLTKENQRLTGLLQDKQSVTVNGTVPPSEASQPQSEPK